MTNATTTVAGDSGIVMFDAMALDIEAPRRQSTREMGSYTPEKIRVGHKLYMARLEAGMGRKELADKLGIHHTTISHWENGRHTPTLSYLEKMAEAFGISVSALLGRRKNADGTKHEPASKGKPRRVVKAKAAAKPAAKPQAQMDLIPKPETKAAAPLNFCPNCGCSLRH